MNIDAVCEFVGDNNCLLTCFLDATNKEDFIILNLQLEPLEWDCKYILSNISYVRRDFLKLYLGQA